MALCTVELRQVKLQYEQSAIESDFGKKSLLVTRRELTKTPLVRPEEDSQGGNAALRISYLWAEGEISGQS